MKLLHIHEPGETPEPHNDGVAVGIDLGTTHSVVAVVKDGKPLALEDNDSRSVIPSVVHYGDGRITVGHEARDKYLQGDIGAVASIKRLMGRSHDEAVKLIPEIADRLESCPGDPVPRITLGGSGRTPMEISAEILKYLKHLAEEALGRDVTQAVITVPAYFDDAARVATRDAALLAGLEVLRLINEPTAAALAYGLDEGAEGIYAIYDLGGGTFDVSLLRLEKGVFQVLSTAGDRALGGDDIDRALAKWFISVRGGKINGVLLGAAREAKESLTSASATVMECGQSSTMCTRQALERLAEPFIQRTLDICQNALDDARITVKQVKGVVLVGGSTRMPLVEEKAGRFFGRTPLVEVDPDRVVAFGAALQAENLTQGGDHLLLDVIPLSLGLETMGGVVEKLLYRNTPIPAIMTQEFTTYQDSQTGMQVHVVQGEREMVDQCRSLARFELTGIPPLPAGMAKIAITFQVDADGLLTVSAEEATTGIRQQIEVKPSYGMPVEEMERMLEESMKHAREDMTLRLLAETRVEASRLIHDIRSALQEGAAVLKDGERTMMDRQIGWLEDALKGTDRDKIDYEVARLSELAAPFAERRMNAAIGGALKGKTIGEAEKFE